MTVPVGLRTLVEADAEVMAAWARDPDFCAAAGWTAGLAHEQYLAFQLKLINRPPPELLCLGAVHHDTLIGHVDLHGNEPGRRELGFLIGERRLWGQGLGTQAARAGLEYGFTRLGLHEIWAEAPDANLASVRILQRLGMTEIGPGGPTDHLGHPTFFRRFTTTDVTGRPHHRLSSRS